MRNRLLSLFLLWIALTAAYSNSFDAGLVFDSAPIIAQDPRIQHVDASNLKSIVTGPYWYAFPNLGLYRPLTTLSYLVNYSALGNGNRPEGYHWVNFILHLANVTCVYALALIIFEDSVLAIALASVWGLHPLLTESVTNIIGRADLLAAFGVLAGFLCYLAGSSSTGTRRFVSLSGLAFFFTVGIFSKENAVVLPAILLAYDLAWPQKSSRKWRIVAHSCLAVPLTLFFLFRAGSHPHLIVDPYENALATVGFLPARLTALKVAASYIALFLWPANLSADHTWNAFPIFGAGNLWDNVEITAAALLCVGILLLALHFRKSQPAIFFFTSFFFLALLPTSNFVIRIGSIMAERFTYLPSIGLAGCLVCGIGWLSQKFSRKIAVTVAAALCIAFAARTYARNPDWHDEIALWSSAIRSCPSAARAHYNLGVAFASEAGHRVEAVDQFRQAIALRQNYPPAHMNLAVALSQTPNGLTEALSEYRIALEQKNDYAEARYNLGVTLSRIPGRIPEAIRQFEDALRIEPDFLNARLNLGSAFAQSGRLSEAISQYQIAVSRYPNSFEARMSLAVTLAQVPGRLIDAIGEFRNGLKLRPDDAKGHDLLGYCLARTPGGLEEAIAEFQTSLRLDPRGADAQKHLQIAMSELGHRAD